MADRYSRKTRYSDGFALTKYTLPVVWQIAEVIPGGFFIYKDDQVQDLIYASPRVFEIYGCEDIDQFKELTGYTFKGMVHPDDYDEISASIDRQIDSDSGDSLDNVIFRITRKDGEIRWIEDYGHYGYSPEYGDLFYVFINDITEKKALVEMSEGLGRFKAGIDEVYEKLDGMLKEADIKDRIENGLGDIKKRIEDIRAGFKE